MTGVEQLNAPVRLAVGELCVRLGREGADIVDHVTFQVQAAEVMGLVGESGSGKTTVALALLGYAKRGTSIAAGSVLVDDIDLLTLPPDELRRMRGAKVAYVPQDPSAALNPALRVNTQLTEALSAHPGAVSNVEQRVEEVLQEVSLSPDLLRRYPHQLSGGQQQRMALAITFACRPALVVLDEPTTGLDVTTQRRVLETVRELCTIYGVAAVYVSHDLAVVEGLASSVAVMYAGRIVEFGSVDQAFGDPQHPYTRALCEAVPTPEQARPLVGLEGHPPRPGRRPRGCSFASRCVHATPACREREPEARMSAGRLTRCIRIGELGASAESSEPFVVRTPSSSEPPIMRVSGVDAWYSHSQVLHDVSFDVSERSCTALVGESGSGKTTLASCISGLHRAYGGTIAFNGMEMPHAAKHRSDELRRQIRYVFQNPYASLNPRQTVYQLIEQPLKHFLQLRRSERAERVRTALEEVRLGADVADGYPDELSGGERQRVAIARALVVEPTLLVCDEVTSSLDVSVQALVVELLRQLQEERRLTLIFITHNLALVRSLADTVVVLADGHVVEAGPVGAVMDSPQHDYTMSLMNDIPKFAVTPAVQIPIPSVDGGSTVAVNQTPEKAEEPHGDKVGFE
jgi:peptide/nickel transport system ATP-binding protein